MKKREFEFRFVRTEANEYSVIIEADSLDGAIEHIKSKRIDGIDIIEQGTLGVLHDGRFQYKGEWTNGGLVPASNSDVFEVETMPNEGERDLAATTAYIMHYYYKDHLYLQVVDKAIDLAAKFIKQYPTGTNWEEMAEKHDLTWDDAMHELCKAL